MPARRAGGSRGFGRRRLAVAAAPAAGADEARVGLDRAGVEAGEVGDALGDGGELHRLEEGDQRLAVELGRAERVERRVDLDVAHQSDELLRQADELDGLRVGQRLAPLRLLDFAGAREQRVEVAVFADQLRRRLDADARRAGHVVGRIAGERLDVDDFVGGRPK